MKRVGKKSQHAAETLADNAGRQTGSEEVALSAAIGGSRYYERPTVQEFRLLLGPPSRRCHC